MIITKEWIHAHKTPAGAWNRKQIEALGLTWPARKGWQKLLEGVAIDATTQRRFEREAKATKGSSLEWRIKQLENVVESLWKVIDRLDTPVVTMEEWL